MSVTVVPHLLLFELQLKHLSVVGLVPVVVDTVVAVVPVVPVVAVVAVVAGQVAVHLIQFYNLYYYIKLEKFF